MVYTNNLKIIAESLVELEERYLTWTNNIVNKGLKVNIGKTKIMRYSRNEGPVFVSSKLWAVWAKEYVETQCLLVSVNASQTKDAAILKEY